MTHLTIRQKVFQLLFLKSNTHHDFRHVTQTPVVLCNNDRLLNKMTNEQRADPVLLVLVKMQRKPEHSAEHTHRFLSFRNEAVREQSSGTLQVVRSVLRPRRNMKIIAGNGFFISVNWGISERISEAGAALLEEKKNGKRQELERSLFDETNRRTWEEYPDVIWLKVLN